MLLRDHDAAYAATLLETSRELYSCAISHRDVGTLLQDGLPEVLPQYRSWGYSDELGWGAAWLYDATGEERYRDDFRNNLGAGQTGDLWYYEGYATSWDDVNAAAKLKLITASARWAPHADSDFVRASVETYLGKWLDCAGTSASGWPAKRTPCGLCYLQQWSSLKYAISTSFLSAVYAAHFPAAPLARRATEWSAQQLRYALGDNPLRISYLIGYAGGAGASGSHRLKFPTSPHHRSSSCASAACNQSSGLCADCASPWVLHGALVGGPDETDCWDDDRTNWERNEVALDYNAALPGLLAWAVSREAPAPSTQRTRAEFIANLTHHQPPGACRPPPRFAADSCPTPAAAALAPPAPPPPTDTCPFREELQCDAPWPSLPLPPPLTPSPPPAPSLAWPVGSAWPPTPPWPRQPTPDAGSSSASALLITAAAVSLGVALVLWRMCCRPPRRPGGAAGSTTLQRGSNLPPEVSGVTPDVELEPIPRLRV